MDRRWDGERAILHADLDCFFASVEVLDNPGLRGLPVVVGGIAQRGVVAAASYEARIWGVRSAMPMSKARRLCPEGVFLGVSYSRYAEVSKQFHALLHRFTDEIEAIGLDEAFIDVSSCSRLFGPPRLIASEIRREVFDELGLSVCVGVGTTKQVAKLASRRAKPLIVSGSIRPAEGVVVVWPGQEQEFLDPLSVGELWGVGPKTYQTLRSIGVERVRDLREVPQSSLVSVLGKAGVRLRALATGTDTDPVTSKSRRKSIGHEQTYPVDLRVFEEVDRELVRLADSVSNRARSCSVTGRTIVLKIRFADFRTITRSTTLSSSTDSRTAILGALRRLFPEDALKDGVRLLGAALSGLSYGAPVQLTLDDGLGGERKNAVSESVEEIRERYGLRAIKPASLIAGSRSKSDLKAPGTQRSHLES